MAKVHSIIDRFIYNLLYNYRYRSFVKGLKNIALKVSLASVLFLDRSTFNCDSCVYMSLRLRSSRHGAFWSCGYSEYFSTELLSRRRIKVLRGIADSCNSCYFSI